MHIWFIIGIELHHFWHLTLGPFDIKYEEVFYILKYAKEINNSKLIINNIMLFFRKSVRNELLGNR